MTTSEPAQQIQAVLRIQWLSFKNSLRRRSERLGLALSALVGLLWYGAWTTGAVALFLYCYWASPAKLERGLPPLLTLILLYWQLIPLLSASMGVSIDLRKMALYPADVRTLFVIECLLRLMTSAEMVLLLGGVSLGTFAKAPLRALVFLPAVVLFILISLLLSAGLRNLLERLLQRRGFREIFLLLVVMASATPQFVLWSGARDVVGRRMSRIYRALPQSWLPSTALSHAYLGHIAVSDWAVMAGWLAAAAVFGFQQFRRSFRSDFTSRPAARKAGASAGEASASWPERLLQLPARLLPDPLACLVEKELRYLSRSPRFRFLFLMGCSFGVIAWLPIGMRRGPMPGSFLQASFLTVLSMYALLLLGQVTFLNSFGFDRTAARYTFWTPASPAIVLLAKNLVGMVFILLEVCVLAVICALLRSLTGPTQFVEALGVTFVSALYLCSVGNLTSVTFPTALSPERVSRAGAGRGVQGLTVFLYPLVISPVLAAYFARFYWHSMKAFVLLLAAAAAGGMALYVSTLSLAARLAFVRREKILQELSRGEGPLVSE